MASIRKRGNSYLIVVSMGYNYSGNRIKPQQKTVRPPEGLTPKQTENGSTSRLSYSSEPARMTRSRRRTLHWPNTRRCGCGTLRPAN